MLGRPPFGSGLILIHTELRTPGRPNWVRPRCTAPFRRRLSARIGSRDPQCPVIELQTRSRLPVRRTYSFENAALPKAMLIIGSTRFFSTVFQQLVEVMSGNHCIRPLAPISLSATD